MSARFQRYVAIGDSMTEGLDDPDGRGGYRGWADRLAERIARHQGGLLYANLGVRGKDARRIREEQLEPALALKPDFASVVVGMNDLIRPRFDQASVLAELEAIVRPLREAGATVLSFTLPDLSPIVPIARLVRERTRRLNDGFWAMARKYEMVMVDIGGHPLTADPRLWARDRLHGNSLGHERISGALAHGLGIPTDGAWNEPLPPPPPPRLGEVLRAEASWVRDYLWPWAVRVATGRTSGDGISAKRPRLEPVRP